MMLVFTGHSHGKLYLSGIWGAILLCLSLGLPAQNSPNIDSLKTIVENGASHDTSRINAIDRLINFYTNSNVDSAIVLAKQMLDLSRINIGIGVKIDQPVDGIDTTG